MLQTRTMAFTCLKIYLLFWWVLQIIFLRRPFNFFLDHRHNELLILYYCGLEVFHEHHFDVLLIVHSQYDNTIKAQWFSAIHASSFRNTTRFLWNVYSTIRETLYTIPVGQQVWLIMIFLWQSALEIPNLCLPTGNKFVFYLVDTSVVV